MSDLRLVTPSERWTKAPPDGLASFLKGLNNETDQRTGADITFEKTGPERAPAGPPITIEDVTANWFGSYDLDDGLRSAVWLSIFTDRRAEESDELPDVGVESVPDRRGYWADFLSTLGVDDRMGSRLWLLKGNTLTRETRSRARTYILESLKWLADEGLGKAEVFVDLPAKEDDARRRGVLEIEIAITANVTQSSRRFEFVWDAMIREGV